MKEKNYKKFKTGYFILYKNPGTIFRNLIEKYQRKAGFSEEDSSYTHIEVCLGRRHSINAKFPKIKLIDLINYHNGKYVKIVKHKISDYERRRKNVAIQCAKRINTFYGLGVVWFIFRNCLKKNIFSALGDFCSELCGYGLVKEYVEYQNREYNEILPKPYDELYPADFLNKKYFELVWEGYVSEKESKKRK